MRREAIELDVVIPVGERQDELAALHGKYSRALLAAKYEARFTYVLDGPMPEAKRKLEEIAKENQCIRVVELSKSFGEASAIMAGFSYSTANSILLLPAYEQVDSGHLAGFLEDYDGAGLLSARRWPRRDSLPKRLQTALFAIFVRLVAGSNYRDLGCGVHILQRDILDTIHLYGEQHRFLPMLAENAGYGVRQIDLPQAENDAARQLKSPHTYIHRLLDLFTVFFVTRFTRRPLRFFGPIGSGCALIGAIALVVAIVQRTLFSIPLADRPVLLLGSLMIALGLQVVGIGLIGELIVFMHARSLKQFRVREIVASSRETESSSSDAPSNGSIQQASGNSS